MRISDWSSDVCSSDLLRRGFNDKISGCKRGIIGDWLDPVQQRFGRLGVHLIFFDKARYLFRDLRLPCFRLWSADEIGSAPCRERVCQYVSISVVAVT